MDSVYLRLSAILDSTASLIPPASRTDRAEHELCQAIYSLALPAAKHRLTKFRSEKTQNGQFLTSRELLKAVIRFEEGLTNQIHEPIQFDFKDPFINPGETRKGKTLIITTQSTLKRRTGHTMMNAALELINQFPIFGNIRIPPLASQTKTETSGKIFKS